MLAHGEELHLVHDQLIGHAQVQPREMASVGETGTDPDGNVSSTLCVKGKLMPFQGKLPCILQSLPLTFLLLLH